MATITAGSRATSDPHTARPAAAESSFVLSTGARRFLAVARYATGFIFFWAFIDKLFGLGFSTPAARAWIAGGSPAGGYLNSEAVTGPLKGFFQSLAVPVVDWIFMAGLLGIGLALFLGIGLRIAAVSGTAMMLLMYLAAWPFAANAGSTNPLVDFHILYALMLIVFPVVAAGDTWGLGARWRELPIVQRFRWLR